MDEILMERYELSMERIRGIAGEETTKEPFRAYFRQVAAWIDACGRVMEAKKKGELEHWDGERIRKASESLYADILPDHYGESFANPAYACQALGREFGKLLSFLYAEIRGDIVFAFEGRLLDMVIYNEAFIEIYNLFEGGTPSEKEVRDVLYWCESDYCDVTLPYRIREGVDPSLDFAKRIIMESDLSDLSYLYRFGEYISPQELETAAFLNGLPQETIEKMAFTYTDGYIRGFKVMGRDLSKKKSVAIRYPLGMERMIRQAVKNFEAAGLSVIFSRAAVGSINRNPAGKNGYCSSSPNKQYDYDHRYDSAVYLDKAFRDRKLGILKAVYEAYREAAAGYAGPAVVETFGEPGFTPENKEEAWAFTEKQQKLYLEYRNQSMPVVNEFIPGDETSFTIIAFPVPEIGVRDGEKPSSGSRKLFEEIFARTIEINTLDYKKYETIQQRLIDALDQAEYVTVEGKGNNRTRMRVSLAKLSDPSKQTKFENCVADVNIPLGEVFTSPVLAGTSGVLNVENVYIGEIQFENLTLVFEDGRVVSADCDNFLRKLQTDAGKEEREQAIADGHKLVVQTIMNQHESLPLGEFAIGTNTTAYAMAEQFGIIDRLPILIVEKMGPHFAVGDTCYSWSEDSPMYNPDGKEMIARDNEVSLLRKTDVSKAYFGVHTDITIPYREIGRIAAVKADGTETVLLADGRFSLPGTEELNLALDAGKKS